MWPYDASVAYAGVSSNALPTTFSYDDSVRVWDVPARAAIPRWADYRDTVAAIDQGDKVTEVRRALNPRVRQCQRVRENRRRKAPQKVHADKRENDDGQSCPAITGTGRLDDSITRRLRLDGSHLPSPL